MSSEQYEVKDKLVPVYDTMQALKTVPPDKHLHNFVCFNISASQKQVKQNQSFIKVPCQLKRSLNRLQLLSVRGTEASISSRLFFEMVQAEARKTGRSADRSEAERRHPAPGTEKE